MTLDMYIKEFNKCCTHCASGIVTDGEFELYCFIDPEFLEVVDGTEIVEICAFDPSDLKLADEEKFLVKPLGRTREGEHIFHDEHLLVGKIIDFGSLHSNCAWAVIQIGELKINVDVGVADSGFKIGDWVEFTAHRVDAEICPDGLLPYKEPTKNGLISRVIKFFRK